MEDCTWLRPKKGTRHINVVELESVVKALNLATKWPFKRIVLHTDSETVFGWLRNSVDNISRLKIKGLSEVLVQRRVQIVEDIVNTCGLDVDIKWVPTADNLADGLTRVPTAWLSSQASPAKVAASVTAAAPSLALEDIHCAQETMKLCKRQRSTC